MMNLKQKWRRCTSTGDWIGKLCPIRRRKKLIKRSTKCKKNSWNGQETETEKEIEMRIYDW